MSISTEELSTFSDISCLSKIIENTKPISNINDKPISKINDNISISNTDTIITDLTPNSCNTKPSSNSNSSNSNSSNSRTNSSNSISCNTNSTNAFNNFIIHEPIPNKIHIDVAVICEEFNNIDVMCEDHIINLDEIDVTMDMFQMMFFPYKENFGLNKDFFINNDKFLPLISFFPDYRSINGKKFYLLEQIISNIEADLCITRYCFTKDSLVELTNEITSIKTLLDIKCCSVLSSLTWSNVLDIIKNYSFIHKEIIPILIVNIVFKTPTKGVKDTVIRFQYKICNNN
jgi:hypothetical protein